MSNLISNLRTLGMYLSGPPDHRVGFNGHMRTKNTITAINTAGAVTLTTAQLLNGLINRDPAGASRTDTTPTATAIINSLGVGVVIGSTLDLVIRNTGSFGEILTLAGGTGVTLAPTSITLDADEVAILRFIVTNVVTPAITLHSISIGANTSQVPASLNAEVVTDNRVLTAADNGKTFYIATDAKVFTLPATALGLEFTFVNSGAAGNNIITIASAVSDYIAGTITLAATVVVKGTTDDKDLINTKATAVVGDSVKLAADGVGGWYIVAIQGIWASE